MNEPFVLENLIIVGAGGSGREVAWLAREIFGTGLNLLFAVEPGYYDPNPIDGIPVVALDALPNDFTHYVIAIGDTMQRRRIAHHCRARGLMPTSLIHPSVHKSSHVTIGEGSIVCAGSILTTNVRLGSHVHINVSCTLSHDVVINDFVTISPGVNVAGNVKLGEGAFIGIGATIINGSITTPLVVGADSIVAAGACVTRPVDAGALVAGVPAIRKR